MLDDLDKIMVHVAYARIENNPAKRVSGNEVWKDLSSLSPALIGGRLIRLIHQGLLDKDESNSSSRTKLFAPTQAGYKMWQEIKSRPDVVA